MNDCLVLKLKESANNADLRKLEYLYMNVSFSGTTANQRVLQVRAADNDHKIDVYENGTLILANVPNASGYYARPSDAATVISFSNRMYIKELSDGSRWYPSNSPDIFEQLAYCVRLEVFKPVTASHTYVYDEMMNTYAGMFNNGRTSGELATSLKVTINGAVVQSPTAVFGENDVKVYTTDKSTLLATFDGTGWSFPE